MVDKARRIFGRKAVAKRGRFGHQIVVVFLPERLQVQYLADVSPPRGGKADAGAAISCGHRLPVSSPTPCLEGGIRSEERRVGTEGGSTSCSRWSAYHEK